MAKKKKKKKQNELNKKKGEINGSIVGLTKESMQKKKKLKLKLGMI